MSQEKGARRAEIPLGACRWEVYQADPTWENCCTWLKHRAWIRAIMRRCHR